MLVVIRSIFLVQIDNKCIPILSVDLLLKSGLSHLLFSLLIDEGLESFFESKT